MTPLGTVNATIGLRRHYGESCPTFGAHLVDIRLGAMMIDIAHFYANPISAGRYMLEVASEKLNVVNAGGGGATVPPLRDTPIPSSDSPPHGRLRVLDFRDTPTDKRETPVEPRDAPKLMTSALRSSERVDDWRH